MRHPDRLAVYTLYRPRPAGQWVIIAHGPQAALVAMCEPGDEICPAGSTPPGFRDR